MSPSYHSLHLSGKLFSRPSKLSEIVQIQIIRVKTLIENQILE